MAVPATRRSRCVWRCSTSGRGLPAMASAEASSPALATNLRSRSGQGQDTTGHRGVTVSKSASTVSSRQGFRPGQGPLILSSAVLHKDCQPDCFFGVRRRFLEKVRQIAGDPSLLTGGSRSPRRVTSRGSARERARRALISFSRTPSGVPLDTPRRGVMLPA